MHGRQDQVARSPHTTSPIEDFVGKVHNRDCLDLMAEMPTASVSMIFADPPFNLGKKYHSYKDNIPFKQYIRWTEKWLQECVRLLKDDGSLFLYNIPRLLVYSANLLNTVAEFRHWIAWNSNGQPLGKTLQPASLVRRTNIVKLAVLVLRVKQDAVMRRLQSFAQRLPVRIPSNPMSELRYRI